MTRRTQADRTAATRSALVAAGRRLFAEHGFAGVGTEAIVAEAAVSRGALYHHFADKTELFAAVIEAVEAGVTDDIAAGALAGDDLGFAAVMTRAMDAWLDACEAPDVQRILLTDGPSVLGWARWRALLQPYALSLIEATLAQGIADGAVADLPPRPLAHALTAVAEEAAMYVAAADDRPTARREMTQVIARTLAGLAPRPPS
ncbi:TetR/AcrR family transcriptional regulator [Nocardioides sp. MH1]|uniref:TetR/AcrR family transcriptional regulator n=1 Tax=Nocardioides sp. MH1 TaxID=3242490 RepID=UPI0035213BB7